jgi:hypothetical protein
MQSCLRFFVILLRPSLGHDCILTKSVSECWRVDLHLDTRWRYVIRFTPRQIYPEKGHVVTTGWEVEGTAVTKRKSLTLQRMGNRPFRPCMMVPDELIYFMYSLFNDDDSSSGHISLNDRVNNDDELEKRWKETLLVQFEVAT